MDRSITPTGSRHDDDDDDHDHDGDGDGDDYKRTIRFRRNNVKTPNCITIKLEMSTVGVIVNTKAIVVIITYVILVRIQCNCQHCQKVDTSNSTILCSLSQEEQPCCCHHHNSVTEFLSSFH